MGRSTSPFGDYLRARRAVIRPEDVGIVREPTRRVEGLRREEVARLAGISPEYYLRLEQGRSRQPSEQVLAGLVSALRLDADGAFHLRALAVRPEPPARDPRASRPDPGAMTLVHCLRDVGALLVDLNFDVVEVNALARVLLPGVADLPANFIQVLATSTAPAEDREGLVAGLLAVLRFLDDAEDSRRAEVVAALADGSPALRRAWERQDVRRPGSFRTRIDAGDIGVVPVECQILLLASTRHAVITMVGADEVRGRATMRYLQALSEERSTSRGSHSLVLADTGS